MQLTDLLKGEFHLPKESHVKLERSAKLGQQFYKRFNSTRLKIAFESFTPDMRHALFEVLFFLHVNHLKFRDYSYRAVKVQRISGIVRESVYRARAQLFDPDTVHGVSGIHTLPGLFRNQFYDYIQKEFRFTPAALDAPRQCPIVSVSTLGSIGTIGHKRYASDLDLQILYQLRPFYHDLKAWSDDEVNLAYQRAVNHLFNQYLVLARQKPREGFLTRAEVEELREEAIANTAKSFPALHEYLSQALDLKSWLTYKNVKVTRRRLTQELIQLINQDSQHHQAEDYQLIEQRLKQRIGVIQDYVQAKFPRVELHLFSCDCESFRQGQHGTTLESKEASGSAYELILNYEVLLPGIQVISVVPSHFVISRQFNNSMAYWERLHHYIQFQCLSTFQAFHGLLVNMGSTPCLSQNYLLSHVGAAYWESFKATSGNLPKALLNLLRIETLYRCQEPLTIIEIIKYPSLFEKQFSATFERENQRATSLNFEDNGLPLPQVMHLEQVIPALAYDPWWLKYKILKTVFCDPKVPVDESERRLIQRTIDYCFALHLKLSDAFGWETHAVAEFNYRERFLVEYLKVCFPQGSAQRGKLEAIFVGDVKTVNQFEHDCRELFANCLDRIHLVIAMNNVPDGSNQAEFEIWYSFFQQHFEPGPDEIPRNILTHLKKPRKEVRIRYHRHLRNGTWVFHASEKLPVTRALAEEEQFGVDLLYCQSFLSGLANCILNGYYGLVNDKGYSEAKTRLEIEVSSIDLGDRVDNQYSIVHSDSVMRLADRVVGFFPYRSIHYLDSVTKQRQLTEILFLLNLFKFGRLSVLYRDNMQSWFVEEFDVEGLENQVAECFENPSRLLAEPRLHHYVKQFLQTRGIHISGGVKLDYWYNPHSTSYKAFDPVAKEKSLSMLFKTSIEKWLT